MRELERKVFWINHFSIPSCTHMPNLFRSNNRLKCLEQFWHKVCLLCKVTLFSHMVLLCPILFDLDISYFCNFCTAEIKLLACFLFIFLPVIFWYPCNFSIYWRRLTNNLIFSNGTFYIVNNWKTIKILLMLSLRIVYVYTIEACAIIIQSMQLAGIFQLYKKSLLRGLFQNMPQYRAWGATMVWYWGIESESYINSNSNFEEAASAFQW